MKLIVGLGNPGKQYEKTRHNAGFLALEELRANLGLPNFKEEKKFFAEITEGEYQGQKIILARPLTFMNDSGKAVRKIFDFYKLTLGDVIIAHDDKDLPLGEIRLQADRGDAGHNGVKSIISALGDKNFYRARIGVASENEKKMSVIADFVLSKFGIFEKKKLTESLRQTVEEVKKLI